MQIKINKIVARPWGSNFNVPGLFGQFPKEFPDGQVKYFYLDWERKIAEFAPGVEIPLRPFPGTLGVARAQPGRYNAVPPGPFAGNLDNRDLVEGTTLHVPVFVRGALVWTGDSHAAQGNGEINLTAIETAFSGNQPDDHRRQDAQARMGVEAASVCTAASTVNGRRGGIYLISQTKKGPVRAPSHIFVLADRINLRRPPRGPQPADPSALWPAGWAGGSSPTPWCRRR